MHEENYYQRGFNGSDQEGNDWIERTEVHECHGGRGRGENEKRYADRYVKYLRMSCVLVLDVSSSCSAIKLSSKTLVILSEAKDL